MNEIVKALSNININSDSAVQIARFWMISEIARYGALVLIFLVIGGFIYFIVRNFGTGRWKS